VAAVAAAVPQALCAQGPDSVQVPTVTLEQAVQMALTANPTVVQARGQVAIAAAGKREAIGNFLPSLSANSNYSTQPGREILNTTTNSVIRPASHSYSASLSSSITLFDGFRQYANRRSAVATYENADAALVNQQFQITLQTKQAFFSALAANDLVRVAERAIQRAEEQLRVSRDKLAAGSAIRSDTLTGQVGLANAQLQLLNAQTQRATQEATLARLIGVDGSVRPAADSSLFRPVTVDTSELRQEAMQQSPVVIQAATALRVADANVAIARAQYMPTLTGSYSRSWSGSALDSLSGTWSLRFGLSLPIFNGFTRETGVSRSVANRETAQAQADDARRQVNQQLTQYLAALAAAQSSEQIAQVSLAAADEGLRVQQERYRLGLATIIDVLTAQVSLDQADVDIVQARLNYLVAKAQIEALIGREL
jgi:outer membrane protein